MSYLHCIARLQQAAGKQLSDDEVRNIFERIHKAALDIKAGRATTIKSGMGKGADDVITNAAKEAAAQLQAEAAQKQRQAHLQVTRLAARIADVDGMTAKGVKPLDAVEKTITRDYSGRVNVESLEQRTAGHKAYFGAKLLGTWDSLGKDWLGFFQSKDKLLTLVRELRNEQTGDAVAAKGAKAFHEAAEEARRVFNAAGGDVGKLDDWGMPQHHAQERVAAAGRDAWVTQILPMLDRARYADDLGNPWDDAKLREFLGKAWTTIATNGHGNAEPGARGNGKVANRHAESRQIHFKDAESVIGYWEKFGDRTVADILMGHIDTMARDIAFVEHFGPNPDTTFQTLRDLALQKATLAEPTKTTDLEGRAVKLGMLYDYSAGRTKPTANLTLSKVADGIAHINTAAKLGGAVWASIFGDKPMMEAVAHLNNLPELQRWRTELALLSPTNAADRRLLQQQGLMLDGIRSGLQRFGDDQLGRGSLPGKFANAVMRATGMQAINEIRKASFGLSLMSAIGNEVSVGRTFDKLTDTDIRALRNYGIEPADWNTWRLAKPQDLGGGNVNVLTPEAISRIPDAALKQAGIIGQADGPEVAAAARREAIVKLLGVVNTESEFAIVTPGWKERATFYADLQRGTAKGEIVRSILQFKSFPWAMLQRSMDAVANAETGGGKAAMTAFLVTSTTLAGAMLMQTREVLSGKDPRDMTDPKFWGAAFLQGGALGIYGDFIYGAGHTRYGSGILEALSGPTIGPLLEMGLVQPIQAIAKKAEGKETHLLAQTVQDAKGFVPGNNMWYTKAAVDHLVWQNVMEMLSPGYLRSIRDRTRKEFNQDWWWTPGDASPDRAPDLGKAAGK